MNFPEKSNLNDYAVQNPAMMELYAVISHFGKSNISGEFVAYCKHRETQEWYSYNDFSVAKCNKKDRYNKGMPYLLFYRVIEYEFN